ncbi:MAG: hypothetical protein JKY65_03515 [Planctomycetes bacterium]|nr:hypothetical protein [Planctomycetota bacterium]
MQAVKDVYGDPLTNEIMARRNTSPWQLVVLLASALSGTACSTTADKKAPPKDHPAAYIRDLDTYLRGAWENLEKLNSSLFAFPSEFLTNDPSKLNPPLTIEELKEPVEAGGLRLVLLGTEDVRGFFSVHWTEVNPDIPYRLYGRAQVSLRLKDRTVTLLVPYSVVGQPGGKVSLGFAGQETELGFGSTEGEITWGNCRWGLRSRLPMRAAPTELEKIPTTRPDGL